MTDISLIDVDEYDNERITHTLGEWDSICMECGAVVEVDDECCPDCGSLAIKDD